MTDLILHKLGGVSTEKEHERLVKIISLASTEAKVARLEKDALVNKDELVEAKAEVTELSNQLILEGITQKITMVEYPYSVGLIMSKELWISAEPANIADLSQKVISLKAVK